MNIATPITHKLTLKLILASWLCLLTLSSSTFAQEETEAIGRIISTTGTVQARSSAGDMRTLARRSEVFVQDTIVTGTDGFAQLRLIDTGLIAFKSDTEFTFEEYSSDGAGGAPDSAVMNMVRGGFRTITGTIGDDNQDDYRIDTPFASIGIRGTTHEALIDANSLFTGVYDGGTIISNGAGSLNTGIDADFDFSQTQPGQAPVGLLQQPDQLGQIDLNLGTNGADDDNADDNDTNNSGDDAPDDAPNGAPDEETENNVDNATNDANSEDNSNATVPDFNDLGTDENTNNDTGGVLGAPTTDDEIGIATIGDIDTAVLETDPTQLDSTDSSINPTENIRNEEDLRTAGADIDPQQLAAEEAARIAAEEAARIAAEEAAIIAAQELRLEELAALDLSQIEIDDLLQQEEQGRVGFIMPLGNSQPFDEGSEPSTIYSMSASDPSFDNPFFLSNSPIDPRTIDTTAEFVFRTNTEFFTSASPLQNGRGEMAAAYGGFSFLTPVQTDFTNNEPLEHSTSFLWTSVLATPLDALSALGAQEPVLYTSRGGPSFGSSNAGYPLIGPIKGSVLVNFSDNSISNGLIDLPMLSCFFSFICESSEELLHVWSVEFDGSINDGYLTASVNSETSLINNSPVAIDGNIHGIFTEDNATSLLIGQSLGLQSGASAEGQAPYVDFLYIFERENRLNNDEFNSLDTESLFVYSSNNNFAFTNSSSSEIDALVLINSTFFTEESGDADRLYREEGNLTIENLASDLSSSSNVFDIEWARWSADGFRLLPDRLDSTQSTLIDIPAYLSSYTRSPRGSLQGKYSNSYGYDAKTGENNLGDSIAYFDISFDVDFIHSDISNGQLFISSSSDQWNIFFNGFAYNNQATFFIQESDPSGDLLTALYLADSGPFTDIEGSIIGSFIDGESSGGEYIPGFTGSFALQELTTGASTTGLFTVSGELENRYSFEEGQQLQNLGLVMPTLNNNSTLNGDPFPAIFAGLASSIDENFDGYPIFAETNLDFESNPFNIGGYSDLGSIVRANNPLAQSADQASSLYFIANDYDVAWGVWHSDETGHLARTLSDPQSFNEGIEVINSNVIWTTVNTTPLATYEGSASYSRVVGFYGFGSDGEINALKAGFDISFLTGEVNNGFLDICAGSSDCSNNNDTFYEIDFTGHIGSTPRTPYFQSDTINSIVVNGISEDVIGDLQGIFTAPSSVNFASHTNSYEAFVGAFNFTDPEESAEYITGTFLLEREDRLSLSESQDINTHIGLLVENGNNQNVLIGGSTTSTSPKIGINFIDGVGLAIDDPELISSSYDSIYSDASPQTAITPDDDFSVQWGIWNSNGVLQMNDNFNAGSAPAPANDIMWASVRPADIADLNGSAFFETPGTGSNTHYQLGTGTNALGQIDSITDFYMGFDVNFGTGGITNGLLSANVGHADNSNWQMNFVGSVDGAFAQMDSFVGTFNGGSIVGDVKGVFTHQALTNNLGFATGFSLNNGLGDHLEGLGFLIQK